MVKFWEWKSLLHHPLVCQKKESLKRKWVNIIEIVFSFCQRGLTRQSRLEESRCSPSQTVIWVPGKTSQAKAQATEHCFQGNKRPRVKCAHGVYTYVWSSSIQLTTWTIPWAFRYFEGKIKELKQNKQLSFVNWKMGFPYRMSDKLCRQHSWAKALRPLIWVWFLSTKML